MRIYTWLIRAFTALIFLNVIWRIITYVSINDLKKADPSFFIDRNSSSSLGFWVPLGSELQVTFIPEEHLILVECQTKNASNSTWTISFEQYKLPFFKKNSDVMPVPEILVDLRQRNKIVYYGTKFKVKKILPNSIFLKKKQNTDRIGPKQNILGIPLKFGNELPNASFTINYKTWKELNKDLNSFAFNLHNIFYVCVEQNINPTELDFILINETLYNLREFQINNALFSYFDDEVYIEHFKYFDYFYVPNKK